jgi:5'-nucleotidase
VSAPTPPSVIKAQSGFWRDLAPSPRKIPATAGEKIEWCVKYVPDLPIVLSEDKGLVYGKLLCDDWPEYIKRWLTWRPRGLVIAVAQRWNVGIDTKFSKNVVRFDGTNFPYVRERMQETHATAEC